MILKPLRDLQVGDIAYLEGSGIVRVLALETFADWVEVTWDRENTGLSPVEGQALVGTWSAFFADYSTVKTWKQTELEGII